jgi:hypothetical protein
VEAFALNENQNSKNWIPACAGMTSREQRQWIPACAGMTSKKAKMLDDQPSGG